MRYYIDTKKQTGLFYEYELSLNIMHYSKVSRDKTGTCNLCRQETVLSWDHVPPQGGVDLSAVEMRTVLETLTNQPGEGKFKISQNGIKYRTICKPCNEFMGQEFDPTLNEFARAVTAFVRSSLELPPVARIPTRPHRLIRGLLGHLVAAKAEYDDVVLDELVRDTIFDSNKVIPEQINIFYWLYPYAEQVVLRDVAMPAVRGNFSDIMFCHLLKYFPVAYLVSTANRYEGLRSLNMYRAIAPDEEVEVEIGVRDIQDQHWPERPDKGSFLVGGQSIDSSVFSTPKKPGKRRLTKQSKTTR